MQYLIGIGLFFFIGGLNAMLIRAELLRPSPQLFGAGNYLTIVGLHGAMMMGIMTLGHPRPVRQLLRPADDRREADGLPADRGAHLLAADGGRDDPGHGVFFGGFPTGWTGYGPLNDQANLGYDSYIFFFTLVGDLDDAPRGQPDRDDRDDARTGADAGDGCRSSAGACSRPAA